MVAPLVVVAVALDRVPIVESLRAKVTDVPSATRAPAASLTVAVMLARPYVETTDEGLDETVTPVPPPALLDTAG